jgi:monoamine oxidase
MTGASLDFLALVRTGLQPTATRPRKVVIVGAMRIPRAHSLTLAYVDKFGLTTSPFTMNNPKAFYYLGGRRHRIVHYQTMAGRSQVAGDYAIITVPFPVLRHVEALKPFSRAKQRAIRQLHYDASAKIFFQRVSTRHGLRKRSC